MPTFTVSRRHAVGLVVALLAGVFLVTHLLSSGGSRGSATVENAVDPAAGVPVTAAAPTGTGPAPSGAGRYVVVDVAGEVRRPGVYRLTQGSRITDAVARAGGATRRAQLSSVDLAAPLADGEQVLVPGGSGVAAGGAGGVPGGTASAAPVDLNTATAQQLDALPGIGPVTAQKIVDYRQAHGPFTSVDQLDAIPGIGAARIDNLRGLVVP